MEMLLQILWYALLSSCIYALIAIGLTLVYGILNFINFAHGEMAMLGAYLLFGLTVSLQIPFWLSFFLVIILMVGFGVVLEKITFKPIRKSHPFKPLIISIGISIALQSIIILFFGGAVKSYAQVSDVTTRSISLLEGKVIITHHQILIICVSLFLLSALGYFLKFTKTGKALRAVADNQEVASLMGINIDRQISLIFGLGTGLAAIAGMLIAAEQNLTPTMGLSLGVKAFAAIILGGVGSISGTIIGALIIGLSENLIVGLTPIPASLKEAIIFLILIIMLFIKPNGLMGAKVESNIRG